MRNQVGNVYYSVRGEIKDEKPSIQAIKLL